MTHSTQAQIEAAAKALYQREMERGEHANKVFSSATNRTITGASVEPFEEYADMWREDAKAALTAAAQVGETINRYQEGYISGCRKTRDEMQSEIESTLAAAQVGEPEYEYIDGQPVAVVTGPDAQVGEEEADEVHRRLLVPRVYEINATIERCAQVGDEFVDDTDPDSIAGRVVRDLVAAIRKLKDAP